MLLDIAGIDVYIYTYSQSCPDIYIVEHEHAIVEYTIRGLFNEFKL